MLEVLGSRGGRGGGCSVRVGATPSLSFASLTELPLGGVNNSSKEGERGGGVCAAPGD